MSHEWKGYANVPLSEGDTVKVFEMAKADGINLSLLKQEVYSGYKLSVKYTESTDTWWVSLTGTATTGNTGLSLSGAGDTFDLAVAALLYKHMFLLNMEWPTPAPRKRNPSAR